MSQILVIGDAHIKATELEAGRKFLGWLIESINQHKPATIVNLGDFFDSHAVVRVEVLSEYRAFIDTVCGVLKIPYFHILGNHEMYRPNDSTYHALQCMKDIHDCFYVIDTVTDLASMTFVPYCIHSNLFPTNTRSIVFAHQTFIGADFGHGFKPETGVNPDDVAADLIISGHIHRKQQVGKVFYPGSPFAKSVDDADQVKGIHLIDDATFNIKFIESPLPKWRSYHGEPTLATVGHIKRLAALSKNTNWVVTFEGAKADIAFILASDDFRQLKTDYSVRVRTKVTDQERARTKIKALTPESAVDQYIEMVYDGNLDKNQLKVRAKTLLNNNS